MFSGIVEGTTRVVDIEEKGTNLIFTFENKFDEKLYIDQSIAHNGVCLTVIDFDEKVYRVEAIKESLDRSNLGQLQKQSVVNLERCIQMHTRLDGHMVQGHVDCAAHMVGEAKDEEGSWVFTFKYPENYSNLIIEKGSITINGISLTVVEVTDNTVSVAIIPYTYEHTNLKHLKDNDMVNLEFDIIGKYVVKYLERTKR